MGSHSSKQLQRQITVLEERVKEAETKAAKAAESKADTKGDTKDADKPKGKEARSLVATTLFVYGKDKAPEAARKKELQDLFRKAHDESFQEGDLSGETKAEWKHEAARVSFGVSIPMTVDGCLAAVRNQLETRFDAVARTMSAGMFRQLCDRLHRVFAEIVNARISFDQRVCEPYFENYRTDTTDGTNFCQLVATFSLMVPTEVRSDGVTEANWKNRVQLQFDVWCTIHLAMKAEPQFHITAEDQAAIAVAKEKAAAAAAAAGGGAAPAAGAAAAAAAPSGNLPVPAPAAAAGASAATPKAEPAKR